MKVLCVSDTVVADLERGCDSAHAGSADLILSCGDLPPEYLSLLAATFNAPLFYVRGNHDIRYERKPPQGCRDIHGRLVRHRGLRFLGLEGSRWYNGGPCQYTESQMRWTVFRLLPRIWWLRGVDIVVTHAPPRGIHDAEDLCHRGFSIFRRLISWHHPGYFLHGHIHRLFERDADRITLAGSTRVVNCYGSYRFTIDDDMLS